MYSKLYIFYAYFYYIILMQFYYPKYDVLLQLIIHSINLYFIKILSKYIFINIVFASDTLHIILNTANRLQAILVYLLSFILDKITSPAVVVSTTFLFSPQQNKITQDKHLVDYR